MSDKKEEPYLEVLIPATVKLVYNPKYGDDKICVCGHPYYRHFDSSEKMSNVGCKYCQCGYFKEAKDPEFARKFKACPACGLEHEGEKCPNGCQDTNRSGILTI
jgi:hypothetical protein